MNVIVANKQKKIIDNANIDAIKDFTGLFNVDDLISKFKNYFFSKLILDATSIVNFTTREVLEKLSTSIGAERLVILLPERPLPPKSFVDLLLELKIYNFSNKIDEVVECIAKPNTYEDIIKKVEYDDSFYVDNSVKENYEVGQSQVQNNLVNNNYQNINNNEMSMQNNGNLSVTQNNFQNIANNDANIGANNVGLNRFINNVNYNGGNNISKKVIGFKNVTEHAGTTTLIFLLMNAVQKKLKKRAFAIEVDKDDFKYYQEKDMVSVDKNNFNNAIMNNNAEIVFVDLNNYNGDMNGINDVIYIVEPSIIKLNKLMMNNGFAFRALEGKKIILNQSFLSNSDVNAFSKEAGVNIFMNIPALNDRDDNDSIIKLLNNLL